MNPEHRDFLNLVRLPGSVTAGQVAILLGITDANIPVLIAAKFLHPLAARNIKENAPKRFSSTTVVQLANDPKKMDEMQNILTRHYRTRNGTGLPKLKSVA